MTDIQLTLLKCKARIEVKYYEVRTRVFRAKREAGWTWHQATEAAEIAAHEVWIREHRKLEAEFAYDHALLALI